MYRKFFKGVHLILLTTFFTSLHAKYSRRGMDVDSITVPANVIGIFMSDTFSPATAAFLAVKNFNNNTPIIQAFTYKHLFPDFLENSTKTEISTTLQNSVIVTGNPEICEQLSGIVSDLNSYLICYGPPTPPTLQNLESTSNLYLSQNNPEAFVPCLFNLIELLKRQRQRLSSPVVEEQEDCYLFTVSMLFDPSHPSALVAKTLFNNLSGKENRVNISWLDETGYFSPNLNETLAEGGLHVVIAGLYDNDAQFLLCSLHRRRCAGKNIVLVLLSGGVDLPGKSWLKNIQNAEDPEYEEENACGPDELLAAAEGHFMLEFPSWETANERKTKVIRRQLDMELRENGKRFRFYYDEAPLAYDSVWAMTQAIARSYSPPNGNGSHHSLEMRKVVAKELAQPFIGLSGEVSFWKRMRTSNKAVIIVNLFQNGKYEEIGKHFNGNSSFPISDFRLEKRDNCTRGATRPECIPREDVSKRGKVVDGGQTMLILLVCLGFLILALLSAYVIFILAKKSCCRRNSFSRVDPSLYPACNANEMPSKMP